MSAQQAKEGADLGVTRLIGPASGQTRVTSLVFRCFVKPFLFLLTLWGRRLNRRDPEGLQQVSLDWIDRLLWFFPAVPGVKRAPVRLESCSAEWLTPRPDRQSGAVMVYFHGSAFVALGLNSHRSMVSYIARVSGARVLNVAYRLAPRARVEDAIEDALDAYRTVLAEGVPASKIVLAGDSAGGFLASMVAIKAKAEGLPQPAGVVSLSGLASSDLDFKIAVMTKRPDAMFSRATVRFINDVLVTGNGSRPTPISPADEDLTGLCPFLLQVGAGELLLEDSELMAERLRAAGVRAELRIYDQGSHVFQIAAMLNPDSRHAIREIAEFAWSVCDVQPPAGARR